MLPASVPAEYWLASTLPEATRHVVHQQHHRGHQSERIGGFTYTFLGLKSNGNYTVRLHFAEVTATGPGQRIFNVVLNNVNVLSVEQIINLFNVAGFGIGVGEWRPEKDGSYGLFHVEE